MKCPKCGSEMKFMTAAFCIDKKSIGRHFWLCQLISGGCGHEEKVEVLHPLFLTPDKEVEKP